MNKFLTKIAKIFLGLSMAAGVGVAVGNNEVARADAASGTSLSISSYASSNNWTNGTAYSSITYDSNISISGKSGGNNNKYYSSNNSWRQYEGDSAEITITASGGATLSSATFTYANGNSGVLKYGGTNKTSGTAISLSGTSASFSVGHSSGTKNGNIQITAISVSYTAAVTNVTVTFKANGHGTAPSSQTVQSGGKPTQPTAPTATGWTFGGWYKEQACTTLWNFSTDTVSTNTDLWAKWTATTYSISYTLNGGTHGSTHPTSGTYDTAFSVSAPTKTGYTFTGWTVTSGLNTSTAKWGTTSSPSTAISSSSTKCVNGTNAVYFKNINAASTAVTLTANWSINSYTVGGTISDGHLSSTANVDYNDSLSITIVPDQDFTYPSSIDSVTMGGAAYAGYTYDSTDGSFSIEHVTGNVVINAACVSTSATERFFDYHLTNCSIESAPESMYDTEMKVLQIVADDHYKFPSSITVTGISAEKWEYDADEGTISINGPDGDIDITVTCVARVQNTITIGTLTGVTQKSGDPTTVEEGDVVTLTFIAGSGYGLPTSSGVTVTGVDSQSWSWNQNTGELEILGGTSNITVSVVATLRDLTNGSLTLGTKKTSYTTGDDFELPSTVTANFNIAPLTVNVKNDVEVSGPVVLNNDKYVVTGNGTVVLTYTYEPTGTTQSASYPITATPFTPSNAKYVKVTSSSNLTTGQYLIVCEESNVAFDGSLTAFSTGNNVSVNISNGEIAHSATTAAIEFTINVASKTIYSSSGYYINNTSNTNDMKYTTTSASNTSFGITDGNFVAIGSGGSYLRYNSSSGQECFKYFKSSTYTNQKAVQLYKYQQGTSNELKWITATVKSGTYYKGNSVAASDFNVTGHYNDGTTKAITSGITVTGGYLANVGANDVVVTASGFSFTAVVNAVQAPVSSLQLDVMSASIGLDESYYLSDISVTINPSIAIQDYTWSLFNDGGLEEGVDYTFDGDEYYSINPGTVVFRCTSDANASRYADFTLTISGVPTITITESSFDGYVGKGDTIHFVYGNISDDDLGKINFVSSNPSVVDFADGIDASEGTGIIEIEYLSAGNATISVNYNNGETLDTVSVSVENDNVKTVTWSASNIDVWSGATLSTAGWNVQYEMDSGDHGSASSYTIKLGGETVTAGYVFKAKDNGKTMHVEYGGVSSSSITVTVTQLINNVYAETFSSNSSDLTFTDACGGSGIADDSKAWTVTSDGTESSFDSQNGKGIHYGTGSAAVQYIKLTSTAFTSGKITKVEVNASTANSVSATVSVTVGGEAFGGDPQDLTSSAVPNNPYTFIGNVDADTIEVLITKPESATKALYCKSIVVTYETSSGQQQIANNASHKAAQRAAVAFAQAFNDAMDDTENCTTGLDAAWSTCSSAYTSFKNAAAALGSTEEAYALNLVKYATAQYSDDSGEACLERMMKTYEICVKKHGKTAFMSDLVTLGAPQVSPLVNIIGENTNTVAIIVIISMVSVTAIGGYFFLRRRKENI